MYANVDVGDDGQRFGLLRSRNDGASPLISCEMRWFGPEVKVLFGISFGYEDPAMKVNTALTERASLTETVTFKSW